MSTHSQPPIVKAALTTPSRPAHSAVLIFLHGLGDSGSGWEDIARQFQSANKLPYLTWIFPSAPENRDAMTTAWYTPTQLSRFPPQRPELEDEEDEEGMRKTVDYVTSLIDEQTAKGVPPERIVLGGFSQGHAMTLLVGLTSKYADRLAGLVCMSGYLPLLGSIQRLRAEAGLPEQVGYMPIFLARGTSDQLVPKRYHTMALEKLKQLGVEHDAVEVHEYEGLGHATNGIELRDLCAFLEKVVPGLD